MIDKRIQQYTEDYSTPHSALLHKLYRETNLKVMHPRMLSGSQQGRFLSMLSHMLQPKAILEIGTYTGYSALCLSEGLPKGGKIITIEIDRELEEIAGRYFKEAGVQDKILPYFGNALELIPQMEQSFDLVFMDADKENYPAYYQMVFDKVRVGGYILADNVLWSGKVLENTNSNDKDTQGIRAFNALVQNDPRVENVLLPIRDGLMLIRKK